VNDLPNPIFHNKRLALLKDEAALCHEDAVLELLVAVVAGLDEYSVSHNNNFSFLLFLFLFFISFPVKDS
jgi:hypothetical protein